MSGRGTRFSGIALRRKREKGEVRTFSTKNPDTGFLPADSVWGRMERWQRLDGGSVRVFSLLRFPRSGRLTWRSQKLSQPTGGKVHRSPRQGGDY